MNPNDPKKNATNQQPNPQVSSVPSHYKEGAPVGSTEPFIKDLSSEEQISTEVKELGVEQKRENFSIPAELKESGFRQSGISAPVNYKPTLHLPINDEKIEQGLHANILSSIRWLSEWCKFQLKRLHLAIKVIHGRVIRVRS